MALVLNVMGGKAAFFLRGVAPYYIIWNKDNYL